MKAIVLAAGEGKRMHPLTYTRPKAMLPLAGKPILEHLLIEIKNSGISDVIFVVGYKDNKIRDFFGNGSRWQVNIEYAFQADQSGTANALKAVRNRVTGNFIVLNGDIIVSRQDIKRIVTSPGTTLSLVQTEQVDGLGTVEIQGERVVGLREKSNRPVSNLVNAGLYLFTQAIFSALERTPLSTRGEYEITDSIQMLVNSAHPVLYQKISEWLNLTYPWELLRANAFLMERMKPENLANIEQNVTLKGPCVIGEGTIVRSGSYIVGPVIIGENCDIGPNCYMRACTALGNGCRVGASVEIKNSIVMDRTKIPHHNYVGDSVIGEDCNLGAGTKIANLRLDGKEVKVEGRSTGVRKLGAIIGDHVETGINSCINVGTMIGNNSHIGPGVIVAGNLPPYAERLGKPVRSY